MVKMLNFAELLLNLQGTPGFEGLLDKLLGGEIEPTMAELGAGMAFSLPAPTSAKKASCWRRFFAPFSPCLARRWWPSLRGSGVAQPLSQSRTVKVVDAPTFSSSATVQLHDVAGLPTSRTKS
jgi:hypothetical protein